MNPQETSISTTLPPADKVQPAWATGCFGLWPRSEWIELNSPKTPEQLKADLRVGLGRCGTS